MSHGPLAPNAPTEPSRLRFEAKGAVSITSIMNDGTRGSWKQAWGDSDRSMPPATCFDVLGSWAFYDDVEAIG